MQSLRCLCSVLCAEELIEGGSNFEVLGGQIITGVVGSRRDVFEGENKPLPQFMVHDSDFDGAPTQAFFDEPGGGAEDDEERR